MAQRRHEGVALALQLRDHLELVEDSLRLASALEAAGAERALAPLAKREHGAAAQPYDRVVCAARHLDDHMAQQRLHYPRQQLQVVVVKAIFMAQHAIWSARGGIVGVDRGAAWGRVVGWTLDGQTAVVEAKRIHPPVGVERGRVVPAGRCLVNTHATQRTDTCGTQPIRAVAVAKHAEVPATKRPQPSRRADGQRVIARGAAARVAAHVCACLARPEHRARLHAKPKPPVLGVAPRKQPPLVGAHRQRVSAAAAKVVHARR